MVYGLDVNGATTLDQLTVNTTDGDFSVSGNHSIQLSTTENVGDSLTLTTNGGVNEKIILTNTQGSNAGAIELTSTAGGIDVNASSSITLDSATVSIDSTDTTNLTMTSNDGSDKTLSIIASNAGVGNGLIAITNTGNVNCVNGLDVDGATTMDQLTVDTTDGDLIVSGTHSIQLSTTENVADSLALLTNGGEG